MVSPIRGAQRARCQAETPLIALCRFSRPVLSAWSATGFSSRATEPLDFEATIEATVLELRRAFQVRALLYDPYQMAAVAQRLARACIRMREYPQTVPNLTAMGSNLYELVSTRGMTAYHDDAVRLAISRTKVSAYRGDFNLETTVGSSAKEMAFSMFCSLPGISPSMTSCRKAFR